MGLHRLTRRCTGLRYAPSVSYTLSRTLRALIWGTIREDYSAYGESLERLHHG